jgi:hypothetical protein
MIPVGEWLEGIQHGVADMNDDDSDWMSLHEAADYVEATVQCYRQKAIDLLREAADNLKLKSRTINSTPTWALSIVDGQEAYHSDAGARIEVYRKDVLRLWPESTSMPLKIRTSPISDGIRLALNALWPNGIPAGLRAKERDNQIREWLKSNKISIATDISRAVQRVLKKARLAL